VLSSGTQSNVDNDGNNMHNGRELPFYSIILTKLEEKSIKCERIVTPNSTWYFMIVPGILRQCTC